MSKQSWNRVKTDSEQKEDYLERFIKSYLENSLELYLKPYPEPADTFRIKWDKARLTCQTRTKYIID